MNIPIPAINKLLKNQSTLDREQQAILEEWLFYNRPSKRFYAVVDNTYAYLPEGHVEIGTVDSFNCRDGCCYVLGYNGILYYGRKDIEKNVSDGYYLIANRNQWQLIEKIWKNNA